MKSKEYKGLKNLERRQHTGESRKQGSGKKLMLLHSNFLQPGSTSGQEIPKSKI